MLVDNRASSAQTDIRGMEQGICPVKKVRENSLWFFILLRSFVYSTDTLRKCGILQTLNGDVKMLISEIIKLSKYFSLHPL